jgi:hypothetical protein
VVRRRIADDQRRRVAASIRSARREHGRGRCKPATPEALMREILPETVGTHEEVY